MKGNSQKSDTTISNIAELYRAINPFGVGGEGEGHSARHLNKYH